MKEIFTEKEALRIAYHELAHIITKEYFGGNIEAIKICKEGIRVKFIQSNETNKCTMFQDICIAVAGFVAEKKYFSNVVNIDDQSDTKCIEKLLDDIGVYQEEIMREAVLSVKEILNENYGRLDTLAKRLSEYIIEWDTNRANGKEDDLLLDYNKKDNTITLQE